MSNGKRWALWGVVAALCIVQATREVTEKADNLPFLEVAARSFLLAAVFVGIAYLWIDPNRRRK